MGEFRSSSQSSEDSEARLCLKLQISPKVDSKSVYIKPLHSGIKRKYSLRKRQRNVKKEGNSQATKLHYSGILQSHIPSTQTRRKMAARDRLKHPKQSSQCPNFQNGDSRDYSSISAKRRVGVLHRYQRRVFPCPHTQRLTEIPKIHDKERYIPIQSTPFRRSDCPFGVHSDSQGNKTSGPKSRSQTSPVPRRLVTESHFKRRMPDSLSKTCKASAKSGLDYKFRKVRTYPHPEARFPWLSLQSSKRFSVSNKKKPRKVENKDFKLKKVMFYNRKTTNVPDRHPSCSRKDSSSRKTPHKAFTVVLKKKLEIPKISRQENSNNQRTPKTFRMVESSKLAGRLPTPFVRNNSISVHRCIPERLGGSLRERTSQWLMVNSRKSSTHKCVRAKSSSFSLKSLCPKTGQTKSSGLLRQQNSGLLPQQRRRDQVISNGGSNMENFFLDHSETNFDQSQTHSRLPQCHSRLTFEERQSYTFRMAAQSSDFQQIVPNLAQANSRHVCHCCQLKTCSICVSNPRSQGLENRCLKHPLGRSGRLCLLPSGNSSQTDSKNEYLSLSNDSHSSRLACNDMVLGSDRAILPTTSIPTTLEKSSDSTSQPILSSESTLSESTCMAPRHQASSYSSEVESRIKAPQRESSRRLYSARWALYGNWCNENKVDISNPSVPQVANFLHYLFEIKKLKPTTISGYRSAIADGLGSKGDDISKSRDLNRLLASFERDRPRTNRSIPSWDLSLVLLALTKAPFEPLDKAELKWLTFKTVFLLALASGKRRSEIHAWTKSSVFFANRDTKVTLAPSPAFLAKNQLASDGPSTLKPVVIPALTTILDSNLSEDRSLCPVRALRIYLKRTKDLRDNKKLVFISFKQGFGRDICRATISQWLKKTILACYKLADSETLQLSQVKAHDVRAFAASLAFKGGVALEDIMSSCFWKSHGTFTNFYLKDVCWHNDNIFKLGPIVSAQHIVSSEFFPIVL